MCGITGFFSIRGDHPEAANACQRATDDLIQRGPDGAGIFNDSNISLGHRRLSVIDISDAASQPFISDDKRYVLVFNGEIFNYRELREKYLKGLSLRTNSDTEVLLHLLIQKKSQALSLLNGFFAFAYYDSHSGELLIARDRYGVKPLFYRQDESSICFSSSLRSLMRYTREKEIDMSSMRFFFHLNYIPSPSTIYKNVHKLYPGSYLTVRKGQSPEINSYYDIPRGNEQNSVPYPEAVSEVRRILEDAVEKRLISDVSLGCFLSGGVDSSVVSAIAARKQSGIHTFSLGFSDQPFFDETEYAQLVANHIGSKHQVFSVSNKDMLDALPYFLSSLDEPFADSSALAVYLLSRFTRKEVTVCLSGDGADELFAGYNKHAALLAAMQAGWKEEVLRAGSWILGLAPRSRHTKLGNLLRKAEKYANGLSLSNSNRYWLWAGFYDEVEKDQLFLHDTGKDEYLKGKKFYLKHLDESKDFNDYLRADFRMVLQGDMLPKVDMMSMANSLEVRTPFLDYRLVDYSFMLPAGFKIDRSRRKIILKDAFGDLLPGSVFNRSKKGFEIPLYHWFNHALKDQINEVWLNDMHIRQQGIFNPAFVSGLKKQVFSSNPGDSTARVWAMIVFQHWWLNDHNKN